MKKRASAVVAADVYVDEALAGTLERAPSGARFHYAPAYLASSDLALAYTLPKRVAAYEAPGESLHPFFANLLPEGVRLSALSRAVKSSKDDFLSMLTLVGADTIGDVAVVAQGATLEESRPVIDVAHMADFSFAELLRASLVYDQPDTFDEIALPGVQAKLSASRMTLSVRSHAARAFILKLGSGDYPRLVENEHFFLGAAKHAGIVTAEHRIVHDRDGVSALLVTRFDRAFHDKTVVKVHQEDGCQILGRYPADKYTVSLRELTTVLASVCDAPLVQIEGVLRLVAFSYVVGNGDLHAKNVSVQRLDGQLRLTPAYDVISTLPYGDDRMAMKIEGRDKNLSRKIFRTLGARHGLRPAVVDATLDAVCDSVASWIGSLDDIGLTSKATAQLRRAIETRAGHLR